MLAPFLSFSFSGFRYTYYASIVERSLARQYMLRRAAPCTPKARQNMSAEGEAR